MTESKYYAPSIEEFHVGFEYEKYDERTATYAGEGSTNWHKHTYDLKSIRLSQLPSHLFEKTIRVKHLDRQDIEECGWEYTSKTIDIWFKKEGMFHAISGGHKFTELKLHYGITDNCLFIDAYFGGDREGRLFEGVIKNKSELKTVMKMLKIC